MSTHLGRQDRHGIKVDYNPDTGKPRRVTHSEGQRVYLVLFRLRRDAGEQFLKVGVSRTDIRARFQKYTSRYEVSLLAESPRFQGEDARMTEQAIHSALIGRRYRPKILLASGNTECYVYDEISLRRFIDIVNAV